MKKVLLGLSLFLLFGAVIAMTGCESVVGPSDTSTTAAPATTTTTAAGGTTTTVSGVTTTTSVGLYSTGTAIGQSAALSSGLLLGVGNIGSGVGNLCGISGDPSQTYSSSGGGLSSASINAMTTIPVAPPDSFFLTREAGWDGYLTVESLHTGETVSLQFSTFNGVTINGAIFGGKQIAKISNIDWDDLVSPEGIPTSEWSSIYIWASSPSYEAINSMWDYILWSSVLNKVNAFVHNYYPFGYSGGLHAAFIPPPLPVFAKPTSEVFGDMVGSFAGTVTRDASASNYGVDLLVVGSMEYDTSITPNHEVPKYLTGEGTVTLPGGLVINLSNMYLIFETNVHGGVVPSTGTFDWNFTLSGEAWSGTTYINSDRTGTGEVRRGGVAVGTMSLDAIGGAIVTVEGVTIPVTAAP